MTHSKKEFPGTKTKKQVKDKKSKTLVVTDKKYQVNLFDKKSNLAKLVITVGVNIPKGSPPNFVSNIRQIQVK